MSPRTTLLRLTLGFALGVALCIGALLVVAMWPRTFSPPVGELPVLEVEAGTGVRVSFIDTGVARVPGFRLAQGLGPGGREVRFRAAVVEHPQGTILFGTGVAPGRSDDDLPTLVSNPFGRVEELTSAADALGEAAEDIDRVILPSPRWFHVGGVPDFDGRSIWTTGGDRWAATSGPWPRRYGYDRDDVEALPLTGVRWTQGGVLGGQSRRPLYADNSVVLVRMRGASAEEIGLYVTLDSGRQILLVGDTVWVEEQVSELRPRYLAGTWNFDRNRFQLAWMQRRLHLVQEQHGIDVVPMMDGALELPQWPEAWE